MESNPLTIRAGELNRLPLSERRKILETQAENHMKLKTAATRRATMIIEHLTNNLEGYNSLWACTDPMDRDDILYAIEAALDADAEEQDKIVAPVVP